MLPILFFACLIIQVGFALKLYLSNPNRKLNIYLSLIPGVSFFSVIVEIVLYYTTDVADANKLYVIYQCLGFPVMVFLIFSVCEYIKNYTQNFYKPLLTFIKGSVLFVQGLWLLFVIVRGPTAHIFLSKPHMWDIDSSNSRGLFYFHLFFTIFWLIVTMSGLIFLAIKAETPKKRWSFRILVFWELFLISGIIYIIVPHSAPEIPQFYFITSIPSTVGIFINVWVLSNFTVFDITPQNIYADVIAASNNWVFVIDKTGKIKFINKAILSNTKHKMSAIINTHLDKLLELKENNNERSLNWTNLQQSLNNNFNEISVKFKRSDKWFNLQSSLKKMVLADNLEVYLWILIDNTNLLVLQKNKELIEAKEAKLSKAYSDISFIMNLTSHDLKVPLKTIIELADLIKLEQKISGKNRSEEYLDYITSVGKQSLTLTTQLIEYMRVGAIERILELCEMEAMLEHIKQRLFYKINRHSAEIIYTGLSHIICDAKQVKELLTNFIENSIKYRTNANPVIEINVSEEKEKYFFLIKDNGIGIGKDFLAQVFSPYSREQKNDANGTGIGLYICKKIIENNHGTISIENNKIGSGITILFEISKI